MSEFFGRRGRSWHIIVVLTKSTAAKIVTVMFCSSVKYVHPWKQPHCCVHHRTSNNPEGRVSNSQATLPALRYCWLLQGWSTFQLSGY